MVVSDRIVHEIPHHTAMQLEDTITEEQRRFKDRILYENLLLQRINAVLFALDNHYSAMDAIETLCSVLLPSIRAKIKPKLVSLGTDYRNELNPRNLLRRQKAEKYTTLSRLKHDIYRAYIMKNLQTIIDELDERGLLLSKERRIEEGGDY
jgi:hypothetical protein